MTSRIESSETEFSLVPVACVCCRLPLPIRGALQGEAPERWACVNCGTPHLAILVEHAHAELRANVRAAGGRGSQPNLAATINPLRADAGHGRYEPRGASTRPLPSRPKIRSARRNRASQELDAIVAQPGCLSPLSPGAPVQNRIVRHGAQPYDQQTVIRFADDYERSFGQLDRMIESLEQGRSANLQGTESITRDAIDKATVDVDLLVRFGINPPPGDYPSRHTIHVAMLSTSVGASLGWDEDTLTELGIGCLLHDVGMLSLNRDTYRHDRLLSDNEYAEIAQHPIYTFDMLDNQVENVPVASRMVAYQLHERSDGSGYPRNRQGNQIHDLAKVAAVADVYIALISARPHRPALMPYHAVEHLLHGVRNGIFDSIAVRALLSTISLFPIGSYLSLSDGRLARTIRANQGDYAKPIVEAWQPDRLDEKPRVIDLSQDADISVVKPLARLAS